MTPVLMIWRAHRSRARRGVWVVALTIGLIGGIALGCLAGARRTASTFAAYARDVKLSDVAVKTFTPDLGRVGAIAELPGVTSSATYVGLNGYPVVDGRVVRDFRYTGFFESLDGRFFTRDRATVIHGRLPSLDATREIALSTRIADRFGLGVGDDITYRFEDEDGKEIGRTRYRIVGVVKLPPVVVDENNIIEGGVLPPAATRQHLDAAYYAWQGIQLDRGEAGVAAFLDQLRTNKTVNSLPPVTQNYFETRIQAQRSIRPQAVALALFGAAAGIAALALGALGISRLVRRWTGERLALRAIGLTHAQLALVLGLDAAVAVVLGVVAAALVTLAMSPLWPFGSLREIAPSHGVHVDLAVILGGGGALLVVLLVSAAVSSWRTARMPGDDAAWARPSVVTERASRSGLPVSGVLGAHFALDSGATARAVPARATLLGGIAATLAIVAALVFGGSLQALVSHPARYGWNWDRMVVAEAGYGSLTPATMQHLVAQEPTVTGWSLLAFGEADIQGSSVAVLGVDRRSGEVEPPVLSGRAVRGDDEIALGATTLADLGLRVGDRVRVGVGDRRREFQIAGTVIFPSIGQGGANHPSLGRGVLMTYAAANQLISPREVCGRSEEALCPAAAVFDVQPGTDGAAVVQRVSAANPDGLPGGTYEQPLTRAADIRNYDEMGSVPVLLAGFLAFAAVVGFAVALVAGVRARRNELAVLRTLGLTSGQMRRTLIVQSLVTLAITVVVGIPLGIIAGRLTWTRFADDIGVVPDPVVPVLGLLVMVVIVASVLSAFALIPAARVSRAPTARALRSE